jgi:hypothetical protein
MFDMLDIAVRFGGWALALGAVIFAWACAEWYFDEREYFRGFLYPKLDTAHKEFTKAQGTYNELEEQLKVAKERNAKLIDERLAQTNTRMTALNNEVERTKLDCSRNGESLLAEIAGFQKEVTNLTNRVWSVEKKTATKGKGQRSLLKTAGIK